MASPTAFVLVVGDELLAGHTLDTNSHLLSRRLRDRGIHLLRREVVPDDPTQIDRALKRALAEDRPSFAFVIGGIGPTPDDRTYEGVGRALDVPLEVTQEAHAWMDRVVRERGYAADLWADPERQEAFLRMIRLPAGARALENPAGLALGCAARSGDTTVFVLPGVPREFERMLKEIIEPVHLASYTASEVTRELELRGEEARLHDVMKQLAKELPSVRVGSYPQAGHRIVVRATGPPADVEHALDRVRRALPPPQGGKTP